jgi:hypothetical protein
MTNKDDWYLERSPKPSIATWIFHQMALGATYAALVLFGLIAFILILRAVSFLLPDDPNAVFEMGMGALRAFA